MQILMDTKEKDSLTFQMVHGVSVKSEGLSSGDYAARYDDGVMDNAVIERKSIPDLFGSFSGDRYRKEKAKWERAKAKGQTYIIAIEGSSLEVLKGCTYKKGGKVHRVKKDGISQVKQMMTISRKYDIQIWWCKNRTEMAFRIQEYFLAGDRMREVKKGG